MGEHQHNQVVAKVEIFMFADGRVTVKGPLENKILCLGLLRAGEDVVLKHKPEQKSIVVPEVVVPGIQH
jgi:hypothetical protein